jgi:S1-C subfamily serine protease
MRWIGSIIWTASLLYSLILVPVTSAQANDLKPAMVRIRDIRDQKGGSGFIFRYDDKEHIAYLLTNEHVVNGAEKVHVVFFSRPRNSVEGTVVRHDRGKDLAVVMVNGESNIPSDVMIIEFGQSSALLVGDSIEILSYSSEDQEWSVTKGTVEGLRREIMEPQGSETVPAIRFSAFVRAGDSGSPLIMGMRVFGLVESAPSSGSDTESQVVAIQDFLKELLPTPNTDPDWLHPPVPRARPVVQVDREAQASAIRFLDSLIHNQLTEAYESVAVIPKSSTSQAAFIALYGDFVKGARGGLIERKLGDVQAFSYPPNAPQIVAPTYMFTFQSYYQPYPAVTVYETVTVIKEKSKWQIWAFSWNVQPNGNSER